MTLQELIKFFFIVEFATPEDEYSIGNCIPLFFLIDNGVKQGKDISPMLFNIYMYDLSMYLNNSGIETS